jgi:hypothetical protein
MGLEKREVGNFITIYDGKFSQRINKPDSIVSPEDIEKFLKETGAVSRVNKLKKTVYEKYHDSLTGKLVSLKVKRDGDYGPQWVFVFQDTKDVYLLQLPFSNSFSKNILKMLPNADLSKEMRLTPSSKVEADGTKKSSIFINQDGKALKHAFTKDAPNGLPPMTQVTVKGSLVWDDTDQMVFLDKMVKEKIIPRLQGIPASAEPAEKPVDSLDKAVEELQAGAEEINPEDIPF